jgi:2-amino-4-hydroxy-6-hydroxymethyldihydropteridine diphosphokinase
MPQCLVSFGSNLGTRQSLIAAAARALSQIPEVENFRASRLYETPPIGGPSGQDPFLNGVAAFDTNARARQVLAWLQELEDRLGRRRERRWGARSIDLDVVLHGNLIGGASDLTVPHPRYTARRFVLRPACDVAADYRDPRFGWKLRRLAEHLEAGNASMALAGSDAATRAQLCQLLRDRYGILTFDADPLPHPMAVVANVPAAVPQRSAQLSSQCSSSPSSDPTSPAVPIASVTDDSAWVSASVGPLPPLPKDQAPIGDRNVPRLIARMQWTRPEERWPAPHNIWPSTSSWPEYRLEVDDLEWAASEVASALASMRCPLEAVTGDGDWWR